MKRPGNLGRDGFFVGADDSHTGAQLISESELIVADDPSARAIALQETKKVGENDKIIFGTADQMGSPTYTAEVKFLRGASAQGVDFDAVVHQLASPVGW